MAVVNKIPLGSGDTYIVEFTGTIPANDVIETDANLLGETSGGASLEYGKNTFTAKSDNGKKRKTVMTEETAKLKLGICTINDKTFTRLTSTATVTEDSAKHVRTTKIGGISKDDGKSYLIRFVQHDPIDGDLRVTIVGKNEAGLTLNFKQDKETILNPEFVAEPHDSTGTLIQIDEEIPQ